VAAEGREESADAEVTEAESLALLTVEEVF
jgi:hypothetical protein